ncbi:MAG TPA: hypothetical protein VGG06_15410 [Thermoanaerobaculia bacterium]|jgi:hypothetical protein
MLSLRAEAARRLGCEVVPLDPETGYLCELRRGARRLFLLGGFSPLNDAGASRIADDKFFTALALERAGFRVPPGERCLRPGRFLQEDFSSHLGLAPGRELAAAHGYPLVVKPNHGARGRQVTVVAGDGELAAAVEAIWQHDYLALVQPLVPGVDVRLDFLDEDYLFGYLRRPVVLRGDGTSAVRELLARADGRFCGAAFELRLAGDPIWTSAAARRGLDFGSVLAAGEVLDLGSPILNLNRLCVAERLDRPAPAWLDHGRRIGRLFGLRHYGVDFKAESPDADPDAATVLEVNSSPSLAQMALMGHHEEAMAAETRVVAAILDSV